MATLAAPPNRARGATTPPSMNGRMTQLRWFLRLRGQHRDMDRQLPDEEGVRELLAEHGAIKTGHYKYESGRHGRHYVEKFRLLERPWISADLCRQIASKFKHLEPEVVAGPTTGGLVLAYETAQALGSGTLAYFAEPDSQRGGRVFARGFAFQPGQRTLVVDDVLTTGGSVRDTIEAVRKAGGEPIGVGVVVDRTNGAVDLGLPFFACTTLDIPSYAEEDCPLCADGDKPTVT